MADCATADALGLVFDGFMSDEVHGGVEAMTQEAVRLTYHYAVTLKTTWSPMQSGDIWTGQFRYSTNISIGSPNLSYLPYLEGQEWPNASAQYDIGDVISGPEVVGEIRFGDVVYITNSSPHAIDVQAHTGIFTMALELASRDLASLDLANNRAAASIPF